LSRHTGAARIFCINDPYDNPESTKEDERDSRKQSSGVVPNVFMKTEEPFPSAHDFNAQLKNSGNKIRLQSFIKSAFCKAASDDEREVVYSIGRSCSNLLTGEDLDAFQFKHS
jgi:hypothetical protein